MLIENEKLVTLFSSLPSQFKDIPLLEGIKNSDWLGFVFSPFSAALRFIFPSIDFGKFESANVVGKALIIAHSLDSKLKTEYGVRIVVLQY